MTGGADDDDTGGAVGGERVVQARGEREVAQMVGGELQLPSLFGVLLGAGHDAGVVHQDVQRALPGRGECGDGRRIGEVQVGHMHVLVAGRFGDVLGDELADRHVADGQSDGRPRTSQGPSRLRAETGGCAGDQRTAAREIDTLRDLCGRAGETEGRDDERHG